LIGVCIAYAGIREFGNTLVAPPALGAAGGMSKLALVHVNDFLHVLLALALVITAARTLGALFSWIHQPPVVGEMIAGIRRRIRRAWVLSKGDSVMMGTVRKPA
jgi:hypothetical protein